MDILNCIMSSDNRLLKLEPSFLNKMQIELWISIIELWISIIELWITIIELWISIISYGYQ